jgi:hypothetical protein
MKTSIYNCFILLFILTSCSKKTEVKGRVYSKNDYPVAGAKIAVGYLTAHGTDRINVALSDADGYFSFTLKMKHKYDYYLNCESDSGQASNAITVKYQKTNTIDIHTTGP